MLKLYDTAFANFDTVAQRAVRRETYGEDIGQTSWMTASEWLHFADLLRIDENSEVAEVGSGSGGPGVYLAASRGCRVTGVDINTFGVANGSRLARAEGLEERVRFMTIDAGAQLPFESGSFDAVVANDVVGHMPNRLAILRDWRRVLRDGGRVLFTDALVVTGALTNEELALRSAVGFYLFVPPGENERLIAEAGMKLIEVEDLTSSPAAIGRRRREARERHKRQLVEEEGEQTFLAMQEYLECVSRLATERRLSRYCYLAEKVG